MLDDWEKMCMGYGLSMFESLEGARITYLKAKSRRRSIQLEAFVAEKGDAIAELDLMEEDGVSSRPHSQGRGHFTFHEFEGTDLYTRIIRKTLISEG